MEGEGSIWISADQHYEGECSNDIGVTRGSGQCPIFRQMLYVTLEIESRVGRKNSTIENNVV